MSMTPLQRPASRGFSLVELMVAVTLGLVLMLGLSSVFISSKQGYRVQESSGRMQESLRFALDIIGRELRHADFWAGVPASEVRNGVSGTSAAACDVPWHANPALGIEGFDGGASSPAAGCTVGSYVANSDVLVTRYADPNELPTAAYLSAAANADQLIVRTLVGRNAYLFEAADLAEAIAAVPDLAGPSIIVFVRWRCLLASPPATTSPRSTPVIRNSAAVTAAIRSKWSTALSRCSSLMVLIPMATSQPTSSAQPGPWPLRTGTMSSPYAWVW